MSLYQDRYNHIRFVSGVTAYIDKLAEDKEELEIDLERLKRRKRRKTHTSTTPFR